MSIAPCTLTATVLHLFYSLTPVAFVMSGKAQQKEGDGMPAYGVEAAWEAAQKLLDVLWLFNIADVNEDGTNNRELPVRLSDGITPRSPYKLVEAALVKTLTVLLTDATVPQRDPRELANRVRELCADNGENIRYNVNYAIRDWEYERSHDSSLAVEQCRARSGNEEISHACARVIALIFTAGPLSEMLAATGAIAGEDSSFVWREMFSDYGVMTSNEKVMADMMGTYLLSRMRSGDIGPVEGWTRQWL